MGDMVREGITRRIDGKSVRMYFHCPYCERRVGYLYDYYKHYTCRKCAKLNYSSQQKSGMDEFHQHPLQFVWAQDKKYPLYGVMGRDSPWQLQIFFRLSFSSNAKSAISVRSSLPAKSAKKAMPITSLREYHTFAC